MFPKMKVAQNTNLSFAPIITIRPNTGYGFLLIKFSPIMFNLLTRPNAAKYVAKKLYNYPIISQDTQFAKKNSLSILS